jgi:spoIIIJ-associated protein
MAEKMTQEIESRGVTVDAAIAAGLERLGVDRRQVEITIIDEGSRGLLGIGSREAVVRLNRRVAEPHIADAAQEISETEREAPGQQVQEVADNQPVVASPAPPVTPAAVQPEQPGGTSGAPSGTTPSPSIDDLDTERETAIQVISELLEKMHVPAGVSGYLSEPDDVTGQRVNMIEIGGDDLSILIGPRGETLDSLQFISRLMVAHRLQRRSNFVVDVEGYRQRRVQALTRLAERMADKVRQRQAPITLEPMSSYERRIIHMALRDAPDVYTESAGEGHQRKVRIYPQ